ncbi:DUF7552 domain-containing protein [Halopenitus persicus]|uniref:DUF7552 domain-containing protein n=1 Tax=Halopenitus persicus TaxID=1048396 RepID=UPI000BBAEE81|nr:hypothetical protein [Halopenitus persicus]
MIAETLADIRRRIESLASDDGRYYLACARTGDRPTPVAGLAFESRETAARAARACQRYRESLRQYDESVPYRDLVVHERHAAVPADSGSDARDAGTADSDATDVAATDAGVHDSDAIDPDATDTGTAGDRR